MVLFADISSGLIIPLNLRYSLPSLRTNFFCPFISRFPFGKYSTHISMTARSISTWVTDSTELCFNTSRKIPPSPPPMIRICLGFRCVFIGTCTIISWYTNSSASVVCITPSTKSINPYFIKLIKELGIKETYFIGGAQAISALTFGTQTIKPVNKIFGPGNAYVAEAKKQLYGKVGIDLLAGPSEIIVVANNNNNPNWVASDLIAQAEHDENAQSILITDNKIFASKVINSITKIKKDLPKKKIIEKSLKNNGIIVLVENIELAAEIINFVAPEHLHIHISNYKKLLSKINNAGGIFLGEFSVEAFGDYIVGTNHVLPTSGAAKFSSGLGVLDFMKRNSIVEMNKTSFNNLSEDTQKMSGLEGLDGHKLSVKIRQKK